MKYGLDIETTGKTIHDKVVTVQFYSEEDHGYFFDVRIKEEKEVVHNMLRDPDAEFVAFFAQFDLFYILKDLGVMPKLVGDAHILALMAQNQKNKLDDLAKKYLGRGKKHSLEDLTGGSFSFDREITDEMREYGVDDAQLALELEAKMCRRYKKFSLPYRIEVALVPVLVKMRLDGLRIDVYTFKAKMKELEVKTESLYVDMAEEVGMDFNPGSRADKLHILYEILGLTESPIKTKKGAPSVSEEALQYLLPHSPWVQKLMDLTHMRSVISSGNTYDEVLKVGRAHMEFRPLNQSGSARIYTTNPAINQLPVELRYSIVPDDGYEFVYVDWSGAELMLMAYEAGQQDLIDLYERGEDPHRYAVSRLLDIKPEDVTDEQREISKIVTFSIVYGSSGGAPARALKIPFEEGVKFVAKFLQVFSKIAAYRDELVGKAYRTMSVRTFIGRRRVLKKLKSGQKTVRQEGERQALNTPIQNGVADMQKMALVRLDKTLPEGCSVKFSVFDSFLIQKPKLMNAETLKPIMDKAFHFKKDDFEMNMRYDIHVGGSFGELQQA